MSNILLEQYSLVKRDLISQSPFMCLHNKKIEKNPHQIDAFLRGISSLSTGGIIFADEVGLGKTIEAGLVIKYLIRSKKNNILIATPASLRVQWQEELLDKFNIKSEVLDNYQLKDPDRRRYLRNFMHDVDKNHVILVSYRFASTLMTHKDFSDIKWDVVVIDEAHNLRNVFKGTKSAKKLYDVSMKIPKLLLTATPLQNSLDDLYGLVSFIDSRIFEDIKLFNKKYIENKEYDNLKQELAPILTRTLRKDVAREMKFACRKCMRFDFQLSNDEKILYMLVDKYVKYADYGFPNQNKNLCILVIRKLLASSSFALIDTFTKVKKRLEKLIEGTSAKSAETALDDFFAMLDSDEQEEWIDDGYDENKLIKEKIEEEIHKVNQIIEVAERIKYNTKMTKLIEAVNIALENQKENDIEEKVVIFTESLRTQKYIFDSLVSSGFDPGDIVIFNGNQSDPHSKEIFKSWKALHATDSNPSSVQFKHAMVDYFENNGKIFISTDSGAEGLNLQFCNIIINYDLPWNPQRIEQRIGRVHRYGQKHDVIAMNFLNTENEADRRVYNILSKKFQLFEGVFGASDEALGLLANDINFEKVVLEIYQTCNNSSEFKYSFDKLDKSIDSKRHKSNNSLKSILQVKSSDEKNRDLKQAKIKFHKFLIELKYWHNYMQLDIDNLLFQKYKLSYNPFESIGLGHGYLFVGGLSDYTNQFISSVLMVTDENGGPITIPEKELLEAIEKISDDDISKFKTTTQEDEMLKQIYDTVTGAAIYEKEKQSQQIIKYNSKKVDNWAENKKSLLDIEISEQERVIESMNEYAQSLSNFHEKIDYLKSIKAQETKLNNLRLSYFNRVNEVEEEAQNEKNKFNKQFEISPIFVAKIILKF